MAGCLICSGFPEVCRLVCSWHCVFSLHVHRHACRICQICTDLPMCARHALHSMYFIVKSCAVASFQYCSPNVIHMCIFVFLLKLWKADWYFFGLPLFLRIYIIFSVVKSLASMMNMCLHEMHAIIFNYATFCCMALKWKKEACMSCMLYTHLITMVA